jgi:hypothetical protein
MDDVAFWFIQVPGWLLFVYLVVAQCLSAISYDLGVRMATQEPAERITEVGVAFFWAFAWADLVFYTPLLGLGLIGHAAGTGWTDLVLGAVLGITVYWPITCLAAVWRAHRAPGWTLPKESQYWIVLPLIAGWGLCSLLLYWAAG